MLQHFSSQPVSLVIGLTASVLQHGGKLPETTFDIRFVIILSGLQTFEGFFFITFRFPPF